jgi:hypothetical protein
VFHCTKSKEIVLTFRSKVFQHNFFQVSYICLWLDSFFQLLFSSLCLGLSCNQWGFCLPTCLSPLITSIHCALIWCSCFGGCFCCLYVELDVSLWQPHLVIQAILNHLCFFLCPQFICSIFCGHHVGDSIDVLLHTCLFLASFAVHT